MNRRRTRRTLAPALVLAALAPLATSSPAHTETVPSSARAIACHRTQEAYSDLRPGNHHPLVRTLQCFLRDAGQEVTVDGRFGDETKRAVITVVRRTHPSYDSGRVRTHQWSQIISATLPERTLRRGDDGHAVRTLQRALLASYLGPEIDFAIDGAFGPQTESYVEEYQSQNGLKPTGTVNRATRALLRYGAHWGYSE